jgi:hypothetical protein
MDFSPVFFLIIFIPIFYAIFLKLVFHKSYNFSELIVQIVFSTLFLMVFWGFGRYSDTYDTEVWNGSITKVETIRQNCPSGWRDYQDSFCSEYSTRIIQDGETCTTTTDSKGKTSRSCWPNYKTQYNYDYDWEQRWYAISDNLNTRFQIQRVNARGDVMPPRYSDIKIGDGASITNTYINWIKAASDSLFHEDGDMEEKYKDLIPNYPVQIYDYYNVDRVIPIGISIPNLKEWNYKLSNILGRLGPKKQMNAIIVLINSDTISRDIVYAIRRGWKGFKKNDAIVFIGMNKNGIQWSEVLSWSKENAFNVDLRNSILTMRNKPIDIDQIMSHIENIGMQKFQRREMAEFEFLKDQIPVPIWLYILMFGFALIGNFAISVFFIKNDFSFLDLMKGIR